MDTLPKNIEYTFNRSVKSYGHDVDFWTMKADDFYAWLKKNNKIAIEQEKKREEEAAARIVFVKTDVSTVGTERRKTLHKAARKTVTVKKKKTEKVKVRKVKPVKQSRVRSKVAEANIEVERLVGMKFGKLTVIEICTQNNRGVSLRCRCDCGKERIVKRYDLLNGWIRSCGCLKHGVANSKNLYNYRQRLMKAGYHVDVVNGNVWYTTCTQRSEKLENYFPGVYKFVEKNES